MRFLSRFMLGLSVAAAAASASFAQPSASAGAANFPSKLIKIINPYSAGGPNDILARIIGEKLTARWHQPVIIETKLGAGGNIAMEYVKNAAPDGYTLVSGATGTLIINQHIFSNMRYDPIKDFSPVSLMATIDNVLVVNPSVPAKNLKEFIAYAKKNPGKITYGSPGVGAQPHLAGEMFNLAAGVNTMHVPYKGASEAVVGLLSNQITMLFGQVTAVASLIESGKVRAIGIAADKRSPLLPNVPTLKEQGLDFDSASIYALLVPKATPQPITDKLATEIRGILLDPAVKKQMSGLGINVVAGTPAELAKVMHDESVRYEKIIKEGNIKVE